MSRRRFLSLLGSVATSVAISRLGVNVSAVAEAAAHQLSTPQSQNQPLVGAIRWGGWFEGSEWSEHLSDPIWWDRLPFYATANGEELLSLQGDSQAIMDQEIRFATMAGLDYWAFCYYDPRNAQFAHYNYGLDRYLASQLTDGPAYALILQGSHLGAPEDWPWFCDHLVERFRHPKYLRLSGNRPLLFLYDIPSLSSTFGTMEAAGPALEELRQRVAAAGLGKPFIVAQNAEDGAEALGFDAFGAYTAHGAGDPEEMPYSELAEANVAYWEAEKAIGRRVVPLINLGWDPRPRLDHPVFGKMYQGTHWYVEPTTEEIILHVRRGLEWCRANPIGNGEGLLLLYAWNEFDEGGYLVPTLRAGAARIEALSQAVREDASVNSPTAS